MSEHLHEILRPVRDIVRSVGEKVINLVVPEGTFDDFLMGGPDNSPLDEPVFRPDSE